MSNNTIVNEDHFVLQSLDDRIQWARDMPDAPLWEGGPTPEQYLSGFVRKPGMGSHVLMEHTADMENLDDVRNFFSTLEWREVSPPGTVIAPGYRYFSADLPRGDHRYVAYSSAILLQYVEADELDQIKVVMGPHGFELKKRGENRRVYRISAITDNVGLVTWYPGDFTPPIDLQTATVKLYQ